MLPKPSLNPAPIRQLTAPLRLPGLAGLAALTLASCAGQYQYTQQAGQTRVHPRVARAQARPIQGIDVSKYQGKIDWASVRSAGTHFAHCVARVGIAGALTPTPSGVRRRGRTSGVPAPACGSGPGPPRP